MLEAATWAGVQAPGVSVFQVLLKQGCLGFAVESLGSFSLLGQFIWEKAFEGTPGAGIWVLHFQLCGRKVWLDSL